MIKLLNFITKVRLWYEYVTYNSVLCKKKAKRTGWEKYTAAVMVAHARDGWHWILSSSTSDALRDHLYRVPRLLIGRSAFCILKK